MRKDLDEYYHALGLNPGASPLEIKRAYRQLIQSWHPDHFKAGSLMQTTAEDRTKEINDAYDHLFKKQLYKKYAPKPDLRRAPAEESAPSSDDSAPPPDRGGKPKAKKTNPRPSRNLPRWRWPSRKISAALGAALALALIWMNWPFASSSSARAARPPPPDADHATRPSSPPAGAPTPPMLAVVAAPSTATAESPSAATGEPILPADGTLRSQVVIQNSIPALPAVPGTGGQSVLPAPAGSASSHPSGFRPIASDTRYAEDRSLLSRHSADFEQLFLAASTLLASFERGDSRAKVLAVQGPPDAAVDTLLRYGSSLVYLKDGVVTGWSDGVPKLRIRTLPSFDFDLLATFGVGSSLADVLRLQGRPTDALWGAYFYGSSVVYFENGRVTRWTENGTALRTALIQPIRLLSLDELRN